SSAEVRMRSSIRVFIGVVTSLAVALGGVAAAQASARPRSGPGAAVIEPASGTGDFVLNAVNGKSGYAPTFTGNGMLGVRVPATGQGYAGGSVPALSELAGFYAQPPGKVQQRANIPT